MREHKLAETKNVQDGNRFLRDKQAQVTLLQQELASLQQVQKGQQQNDAKYQEHYQNLIANQTMVLAELADHLETLERTKAGKHAEIAGLRSQIKTKVAEIMQTKQQRA